MLWAYKTETERERERERVRVRGNSNKCESTRIYFCKYAITVIVLLKYILSYNFSVLRYKNRYI